MDTIDKTSFTDGSIPHPSYDVTEAQQKIDAILADIRDDVEEVALELDYRGYPITRSRMLAQIIMVALDDGGVSKHGPEATFKGQYDTAMKVHLVEMADHMGPDWAQALYRAAVFITKVA